MRIAIYVRKSKWTGRGESIENQILMCREYIEKVHRRLPGCPDPGLQPTRVFPERYQQARVSENVRRHETGAFFSIWVCYRLDRLGRNLADLALLIEKLNREHTEFVSIKEHFDTTTPMGKAMVYFSGECPGPDGAGADRGTGPG